MSSNLAALEALLFIYGEALPVKKAAKILKISDEELGKVIVMLTEELKNSNRGLTLINHHGSLQLVTKKEFSDAVQKLVKQETGDEITPAALETLSIIAYSGPVSKANIEHIRGVNSSFTLRNLLIKGLIDKQEDKGAVGDIYFVSNDFLKYLGITNTDQLPEYQKYNHLIKQNDSK